MFFFPIPSSYLYISSSILLPPPCIFRRPVCWQSSSGDLCVVYVCQFGSFWYTGSVCNQFVCVKGICCQGITLVIFRMLQCASFHRVCWWRLFLGLLTTCNPSGLFVQRMSCQHFFLTTIKTVNTETLTACFVGYMAFFLCFHFMSLVKVCRWHALEWRLCGLMLCEWILGFLLQVLLFLVHFLVTCGIRMDCRLPFHVVHFQHHSWFFACFCVCICLGK